MKHKKEAVMRTKQVLAVLLVLGTFFGSSVMAQAADLKWGVVNLRDVLEKSQQYKVIMTKLQKEFEPKEKNVNKLLAEYKTKADAVQKDAAVLSEIEKARKERELANMQRDIQRLQGELHEDKGVRQQEEMQKFMMKLKTVMHGFATDQKYDLLIPQDVVLYVKESFDVTESVRQAFDKATVATDKKDTKKG
jgi:outer membrane protein